MAGLVPGEPLNITRIENYRKRLGNLHYFVNDPDMGKPLDVVGLDFDNTIVCYDRLFHRLARERG